jgi:hypothetical protein
MFPLPNKLQSPTNTQISVSLKLYLTCLFTSTPPPFCVPIPASPPLYLFMYIPPYNLRTIPSATSPPTTCLCTSSHTLCTPSHLLPLTHSLRPLHSIHPKFPLRTARSSATTNLLNLPQFPNSIMCLISLCEGASSWGDGCGGAWRGVGVGRGPTPLSTAFPMTLTFNNMLLDLNANPELDFLTSHNAYLSADENVNPYENLTINS